MTPAGVLSALHLLQMARRTPPRSPVRRLHRKHRRRRRRRRTWWASSPAGWLAGAAAGAEGATHPALP